jgi:uroporphyrinogen decarboxylase
MTPRERVRLALEHKQTERVSIGYVATPETNESLKKYLKADTDEKLLKRLGVDYRWVNPGYKGPKELLFEDCWDKPGKDIWGVERKNIKNKYGTYMEISSHPLRDLEDASQLEDYKWPDIDWIDFEILNKQIDMLDQDEEYWIILNTMSGSVFEMAWYMRGMEKFLMDLLINPDMATGIIKKLYQFAVGSIDRAAKATNRRIDMVLFADDIASQESMLISVDTWRKMIRPWHKEFYKKAHQCGARAAYHSCGSITPVIDDLIGIGLDVLNPLQFSAKNFPDPEILKEKYGDRLSFMGGMDIQTKLPFYSIEEIKKETKRLIEILGKDGGYIIQATHNIQPDTPPENIVAMHDVALSYHF